MKVLIIVAMQSELEGFLNKVEYETILVNGSKVHTFKVNDNIIYLSKCEVGKVNAAMLTTSLILKLKPQFVINAGIAGGLNQSINLLDVIASSKVAYHDFDLTAFGLQKGEMDNGLMYFKGCTKLEAINIPSSVQNIGIGAFENCIALKNVMINGNITEIKDYTISPYLFKIIKENNLDINETLLLIYLFATIIINV